MSITNIPKMTSPAFVGFPAARIFTISSMIDRIRYSIYPLKKGRRGKPHWRSLRMLRYDIAYKTQWDALAAAFREDKSDSDSWSFVSEPFEKWLKEKIKDHPGVRVVTDIFYQQIGLHFDDENSKLQFILTWAA